MSDALSFKVRMHTEVYGDRRKFVEYRILFCWRGEIVGIEEGQRRETKQRADALRAARARVKFLKSRRLYVIKVTRKHIADGEARDCNTCAIAQALWHNQERMGFPKREYSFEVSPYGAFIQPRGIVLSRHYADDERALPADELPDMVWTRGRQFYPESMMEWAMQFDDWAESRGMSLKNWREEHGHLDDERPCRPGPMSFVLDLDAFVTPKEST